MLGLRKRHNLGYLLDLINEKEKVSDEYYEMTEKLEDYAIEIRYPDDWTEPTLEDAKESYEIAKQVKEFVLSRTNIATD